MSFIRLLFFRFVVSAYGIVPLTLEEILDKQIARKLA